MSRRRTSGDIVTLAGCPNPYALDDGPGRIVVLCGCPGVGDYRPRHWVATDGTPFHCTCAPRQWPAGSGGWLTANDLGYACRDCGNRLPEGAIIRRLACDMNCCWCGGLARANWGYRVWRHEALGEPRWVTVRTR